MLDGLCHAACHLTFRKGFPCGNINVDLARLIEKSNQIRCKRCINGSLSAHGCICSSQKCGRIIDKRYASAICSCQKSCQIRNNPSADCNHSTISAEPFFQHGIFNLRLRLSGLTFFSCGKYEQFHFKSSLAQLFTDWFCIQIQYIGIRDHGKLPDFSQKTGL